MALELLGIPAMSVEIERAFSSSGLLITDRRNHLKEDIIEMVECLKSWTSENANGNVTYPETAHNGETAQFSGNAFHDQK